MEAQAVISQIHAARTTGVKRGLENTARLMEALHIVPTVPVIHVAGTNGKGSTCAMLESALQHVRTGLFTSPFLQRYEERIRINGQNISDEQISRYGTQVLACAEDLRKEGIFPTPFELGTVLAAAAFQGEKADVWVLETGMGGLHDPTTAIPADLCGITSIGLDHRQYLGDTIEEIAREKAGIMRKGAVCVAAGGDGENVLREEASRIGAELICPPGRVLDAHSDRCGSDALVQCMDTYSLHIPLPGEHQIRNALTAVRMLEELNRLGLRVTEEQIIRGIENTRWPARLEWAGSVLIDGAHNPPAVEALGAYVKKYLEVKPVLLTAVMEDKDTDALSQAFSAFVREAVAVTLPEPRAMSDAAWAEKLRSHGIRAQAGGSVQEGMARAIAIAGDRPVLCAGSLYLAGAVRTLLGLK